MHLLLSVLGHGVKSATVLEPLDLALVEGVRKLDLERVASVRRMNRHREWLTRSKLGRSQINAIVRANLVIIGGVREGEGKHA
jgi:hypothetical protein